MPEEKSCYWKARDAWSGWGIVGTIGSSLQLVGCKIMGGDGYGK